MAHIRYGRIFRTITAVGATALLSGAALATPIVESSCPAPCDVPPKAAIFGRESFAFTDATGGTADLWGTLRRGTPKTAVRAATTIMIAASPAVNTVYATVRLNGYPAAGLSSATASCTVAQGFCTVTGTFWFDIDVLEATHPGEFIGQPLVIQVSGRNLPATAGLQYQTSYEAEIVKKK